MADDLIFRLRERARIRRQIPGRKSVENGEPDRIADLLDEAANALARLTVDFTDMADRAERAEKRAMDAWRQVEEMRCR